MLGFCPVSVIQLGKSSSGFSQSENAIFSQIATDTTEGRSTAHESEGDFAVFAKQKCNNADCKQHPEGYPPLIHEMVPAAFRGGGTSLPKLYFLNRIERR